MESKRRGRPPKTEVAAPKTDSQEFVEIFVIRQCPNKVWLQGTTRDQVKAYVKVRKDSIAPQLVGKWVKGTKIDGGEENQYNFLA